MMLRALLAAVLLCSAIAFAHPLVVENAPAIRAPSDWPVVYIATQATLSVGRFADDEAGRGYAIARLALPI